MVACAVIFVLTKRMYCRYRCFALFALAVVASDTACPSVYYVLACSEFTARRTRSFVSVTLVYPAEVVPVVLNVACCAVANGTYVPVSECVMF